MSHLRNFGGAAARKKMAGGTHHVYSRLNLGSTLAKQYDSSNSDVLNSRDKAHVIATNGTEWGKHLKQLKNANKLCKENRKNCEELKKECESAKKFLESIKEDPLRLEAWKEALKTYETFLAEYTRSATTGNSNEMKNDTKQNSSPIQKITR